MHPSVAPHSTTRPVTVRYLSWPRLQEILVLQGAPLLGAAFALGRAATSQPGVVAVLLAANLCLVAHIFVLNDWANHADDLADPNKAATVFSVRGVGSREMGVLAAVLLAGSLLLFSWLGPVTLTLAGGIATLSALYSLPPFGWKARPLLNSLAHLAGGVLHFLLGYSLGNAVDRPGMVAAAFVAVTFAAGHLTQELRDHAGDARSGIRTNAVAFGQRAAFTASLALFTLSHVLLLLLTLDGVLPRATALLVLLYPVQLRWSLAARREGLTFASVANLQTRYRALYAVIGVSTVAGLWWR